MRALLEIHRTRTCGRVLATFAERTEAPTVFDPPPRPDDVAVQAFGGLDDVALDADEHVVAEFRQKTGAAATRREPAWVSQEGGDEK